MKYRRVETGSRKFNYELVGGKTTEVGNVLGEGKGRCEDFR